MLHAVPSATAVPVHTGWPEEQSTVPLGSQSAEHGLLQRRKSQRAVTVPWVPQSIVY